MNGFVFFSLLFFSSVFLEKSTAARARIPAPSSITAVMSSIMHPFYVHGIAATVIQFTIIVKRNQDGQR